MVLFLLNYNAFINRYCKDISETEESELRLFASKRKQESLGKGTVLKFVSNSESNENTRHNLLSLDPNKVNGKEGKCDLILPNERKCEVNPSACTEVTNVNEVILNNCYSC